MKTYTSFVVAALAFFMLISSCSGRAKYCKDLTVKLTDTQADLTFASTTQNLDESKSKLKKAVEDIKAARENSGADKCNCPAAEMSIIAAQGMIQLADSANNIDKIKFFADDALKSIDNAELSASKCEDK